MIGGKHRQLGIPLAREHSPAPQDSPTFGNTLRAAQFFRKNCRWTCHHFSGLHKDDFGEPTLLTLLHRESPRGTHLIPTPSTAPLMASALLRPLPPLNYDPSAYELTAAIPRTGEPWRTESLHTEIQARAADEKARREMQIHYYRIGYTLAFPLPVARRHLSGELPVGIASLTYPWLIWLSWELEERWRILHASWRLDRDDEAGCLLQQELAALTQWDRFTETSNEVGLVTGHFAAVLALALADESDWDSACLAEARRAADLLLDRDITPWFARQWPEGKRLDPVQLHNIPVIALTRAAQLARVRGHALTDTLDRQATAVLRAWAGYRTSAHPHTEGTAYDGYLMEAITGWLEFLPDRETLLAETRAAFRSQVEQWLWLTLPGRLDLHAPLGDTEPEMPFWIMPLLRLARWYDWNDAGWGLRHIPTARLPAAALTEALTLPDGEAAEPSTTLRTLANAVTARSGWQHTDHVVLLSAPRCSLHHLHNDGGHFMLGWHGRFWISDPGYQQYRPGEERDYSIGLATHNAPVINGCAQTLQATRIESLQPVAGGHACTQLDLSACYTGLPAGAVIRRTWWHAGTTAPLAVLRDDFNGLGEDTEILTHWLGGTHFAWAFVDGWARLSNGTQALWIGTTGPEFSAPQLIRHPGSRGPLTLRHAVTLSAGQGATWWVFWGDEHGGWTPPRLETEGGRLTLHFPGASPQPIVFS